MMVNFGRGLACHMDQKFNLKEECLKSTDRTCPGLVVSNRAKLQINKMITKNLHYDKPTPKEVEQALLTMKSWIMKNIIPAIAMPEFSRSLDKLRVETLKGMFLRVF